MRSVTSRHKDPAPSRLRYRITRLWLRPVIRRIVCVGLPVAICVGGLAGWVTTGDRIQVLRDQAASLRQSIEEKPEFMVKLMAIDGASPELDTDIRELLPVEFPVSSFDLDLDAMRKNIEALDAVQSADLRIKAAGLLHIDITQRVPAVVWRGPDGLTLLDDEGHRVKAIAERAAYRELPVIAGEGAADHVAEALDLMERATPIDLKMIGLVRMSETRWDVVLEAGLRVMLPEDGALDAFDRVIALHEAQDLLSRDVTHIDMRQQDRPTIRLSQNALADMREMRAQMMARLAQEKNE